jgi:hypothetical protein
MQRFRQAAAAMLIALVLVGCSAEPPPLPPDAPGIIRPEEYSFGDAVRSRDFQATMRVLDKLEARFGEKSMDIAIRNLPDDADPGAIQAYYQQALTGWRVLELGDDPLNQSWSFALVSPDGGKALALVALKPDGVVNGGQVPLNILTNLKFTP